MSRKAINANKEKRRREKAARRASQQKQYQTWRDEGVNKKSKRYSLKSQRGGTVGKESHPNGRCYNVGCERCFPVLNINYPWPTSNEWHADKARVEFLKKNPQLKNMTPSGECETVRSFRQYARERARKENERPLVAWQYARMCRRYDQLIVP